MLGKFGPRYACSDAVTFKKDTVLKKVDSRFAGIEVGVTQAAHELGQVSGLFYVPEIVGYDKTTGVIEFERISRYITLGQLLARTDDNLAVIQKIGMVLACIHEHLELPADLQFRIGKEWLTCDDDIVPMHGDFNTVNVGCNEQDGKIVIVDWARAPILPSVSTVGPFYWDLAAFLNSLLAHQANFVKAVRLFQYRRQVFLDGYMDNSQRDMDTQVLKTTLLRISAESVRSVLSRRKGWKWAPYAVARGLSHIMFRIS